jgi:hypothetical protein
MVRVGTLISMAMLCAVVVAGCGGAAPNEGAEREAERVASAWVDAMWRLDFQEACALEFTDHRGRPYRDKTEAAKKRECEVNWEWEHPDSPAPRYGRATPEPNTVKRWYGLSATEPVSALIKDGWAIVWLRDPQTDQHREISLLESGDRWVVYDENVEHRFGG